MITVEGFSAGERNIVCVGDVIVSPASRRHVDTSDGTTHRWPRRPVAEKIIWRARDWLPHGVLFTVSIPLLHRQTHCQRSDKWKIVPWSRVSQLPEKYSLDCGVDRVCHTFVSLPDFQANIENHGLLLFLRSTRLGFRVYQLVEDNRESNDPAQRVRSGHIHPLFIVNIESHYEHYVDIYGRTQGTMS